MAAGNFTVFDIAKLKIARAIHDLDSHVFKCALTTQAETIAANYAGTSTDCRYTDLAAQVANGGGYVTGGLDVTLTVTRAGGTITVDASDISIPNATIQAKYGVIYNFTNANKDLLGFSDLDTGNAAGISSTNGTFAVTWNNPNGIFQMA